MKKLQNISILTFILFAIFSLALSNIVNAQKDSENEKKVRIKIVTEENGKKEVIDTTFYNDDFDKEAFMKEHNIKIDEDSDNMKLKKEIYVTIEEDEDGNIKKIIKSDGDEKTIIIKKHHGLDEETELMIIMESELDDLDEKMKDLDAEMIELESEMKVKMKKIKVDSDGGGETYIITIEDDDSKSDKKMIFITEDGEKIIIKSDDLDDDHEFIYHTDDGEVIKKKDGKVIVKTITVTVDDDDDDDDDDND